MAGLANVLIKNFQNELLNQHSKAWELDAEAAEFYQAENLIVLSNFTMKRLSPDPPYNPITIITGLKAALNNHTKNIILTGNVVIEQPNKVTIKGESFTWHNEAQLLTSTEFVEVNQTGRGLVRGIGFEATHDLENIAFKKQTSGVLIQ